MSDQNLAVRVELGSDTAESYVARTVAQGVALGERVAAVVKTQNRASELSDAIVKEIKTLSGGTTHAVTIGGRLWATNMPVVLARGEIEGLERGGTYYVAVVSRNRMVVESADGQRHQLTSDQVIDHLDSGLALTTRRVALGTAVTTLVAEAEGLADYDLIDLAERQIPTTLVLTDPDLAAERQYDLECRDDLEEAFVKEMKFDPRAYSATHFIDDLSNNRGIAGLRAGVQEAEQAVYNAKTHSPRDLSTLDLERDLLASRDRLKDLKLRIEAEDLTDEDVEDARIGVEQTLRENEELERRHDALVSNLPDDDPTIAAELAATEDRHAGDFERLEMVKEDLHLCAQARVAVAMKLPRPYHSQIEVDSDLPISQAEKLRRELIVEVEEFRTRWGITDLRSPLGTPTESGTQQQEWAVIARRLGVIAGPNFAQSPDLGPDFAFEL